MKKILSTMMVMILTMSLFTGCGSTGAGTDSTDNSAKSSSEVTSDSSTQATPEATTDVTSEQTDGTTTDGMLTGKHHVKIKVENYGTIAVELDADVAPITVTNFIKLAKEGFYDGLTFHRIITGFMIQGGDPNGDGSGGSEETIKGEFSENGVENNISHVRGTISMARATDYDSGSSQFFIVQADSTFLDGQYAGFGTVTKGMDIVDQICDDTPVTDSNGTVETANQPVITTIKVVD